MDGRAFRIVKSFHITQAATAALLLAAITFIGTVRGQAMGKAEVEAPITLTPAPAVTVPAVPAAAAPVAPIVIEAPKPAPEVSHLPPQFSGLNMTPLPTIKISETTPATPITAAAPLLLPTPTAPVAFSDIPATPHTTDPVKPEPKIDAVAIPAATAPAAASLTADNAGGIIDSIENTPIRATPSAGATATTQPMVTGPSTISATKPATKSGFALPTGLANFAQVGGALAIVIGLIFIAKAATRKFVPGAAAKSGKGVIEILARHPLAKNQSLVLVRIGSQIVALNQCKESSESVLVISEPTEVAKIIGQIEGVSPNSIQAGFTKLLANARMDLEKDGEDRDRDSEPELRGMNAENLDEQLEEMAAAKRQLMELRQHVRSVRDSLPRA